MTSLELPRAIDVFSAPAENRLILERAQLFRNLGKEDIDPLLNAFSIREWTSGAVIYAQGAFDHHELFVLLRGRVSITRRSNEGRGRSELIGPGETFGELSVLDPGPHERTATTLTAARVASLDRASYINWALARPHVAERLLRVLARRLRRTDDEVLDLLFVDVGARLAKAIIDMASRFGVSRPRGVEVDHALSQQQLAEMVGTSRETLNKQLNAFVDRGWLSIGRGRFVVRDPARLAARATVGEAPPRISH